MIQPIRRQRSIPCINASLSIETITSKIVKHTSSFEGRRSTPFEATWDKLQVKPFIRYIGVLYYLQEWWPEKQRCRCTYCNGRTRRAGGIVANAEEGGQWDKGGVIECMLHIWCWVRRLNSSISAKPSRRTLILFRNIVCQYFNFDKEKSIKTKKSSTK